MKQNGRLVYRIVSAVLLFRSVMSETSFGFTASIYDPHSLFIPPSPFSFPEWVAPRWVEGGVRFDRPSLGVCAVGGNSDVDSAKRSRIRLVWVAERSRELWRAATAKIMRFSRKWRLKLSHEIWCFPGVFSAILPFALNFSTSNMPPVLSKLLASIDDDVMGLRRRVRQACLRQNWFFWCFVYFT